ncbi:MAG: DUF2231 domain-containing protein [Kibdelosporangium sp.]
MPVFLAGLPLHVLVVHAIVVLVPLAVVGTLAIAFWPAVRRRFGLLVLIVTALATALIPIATGSGEDLRDRLASTDLIRRHAELGDQLMVFMIGLTVVAAARMWIEYRKPDMAKAVTATLAVLMIGCAAVSAVQVVRIGDSGARAAWSTVPYTAPQPHGRH